MTQSLEFRPCCSAIAVELRKSFQSSSASNSRPFEVYIFLAERTSESLVEKDKGGALGVGAVLYENRGQVFRRYSFHQVAESPARA